MRSWLSLKVRLRVVAIRAGCLVSDVNYISEVIMFDNAEYALRWAAQVKSTELYKAPSINKMCGKPSRTTLNELLIGLSPDETRKQADNIHSIVINLSDPVAGNYLLAKYFHEPDISRLMSRVHISLTDRSRDMTILIKSYLGHRITHRTIRDSLGCNNNRVSDYKRVVFDLMDKIHYQAIDQVERKMQSSGIVGCSCVNS